MLSLWHLLPQDDKLCLCFSGHMPSDHTGRTSGGLERRRMQPCAMSYGRLQIYDPISVCLWFLIGRAALAVIKAATYYRDSVFHQWAQDWRLKGWLVCKRGSLHLPLWLWGFTLDTRVSISGHSEPPPFGLWAAILEPQVWHWGRWHIWILAMETINTCLL